MLHQVARAVAPHLPLAQALRDWNRISADLADPTRKRAPQLAQFFD